MSKDVASQQKTPVTLEDVKRIQSSEAKQNGGGVTKDSFTARVARAAEKNKK